MSSLPKISIIIPVHSLKNDCIAANSARECNYPVDKLEIIIAQGTEPSRQRNIAAKKAKGDILYFLDNDSLLEVESLNRLASFFLENSDALIVGGPSIGQEKDTSLQKIFTAVLASSLGQGPARHRYFQSGKTRKATENELILCNMAVKRNYFLKENGFSTILYPNEENEFILRTTDKTNQIYYIPSLFVYRSPRESFKHLVRQMFRYGQSRATLLKTFHRFNYYMIIPALLIIYFTVLTFSLFSIDVHSYFLLPALLYILSILVFSLSISASLKRSDIIFGIVKSCITFVLIHFSYGLGFLYSLILKGSLLTKEQRVSIHFISD